MESRTMPHLAIQVLRITFAVTILAMIATAQAPVYFGDHSYPTSSRNSVVADMNGDGHPDIISAAGTAVDVLLNTGAGAFTGPGNMYAPTPFPGETEIAICTVAVGDLNGDGKPDVAAADCGTGVVHIFVNNGDGSLTFLKDLGPIGGSATSVVIADLNGDGKNDVAATSSSNIDVFFNTGSANFSAPWVSDFTNQPFSSITAGDINGDGLMDLAALASAGTSHAQSYQLINSTARGSVNGTFTAFLVSTGTADSLKLVDIDKDGHADLLVPFSPKSDCTTPCNSSGISWFFNNPDGSRTKAGYTFVSPGNFFVGGGGADAADLNGDGLNDIVFSVKGNRNESIDEVRYLLATGKRTFAPVQPNQTAGIFGIRDIAAADLNGDHLSDIVATQIGGQSTDVKLAIAGNAGWGVNNSQYCAPPSAGLWNVCAPTNGTTYAGGAVKSLFFQGVATAPSGQSVLSTQLFIDGTLYDTSSNRSVIGIENLGTGSHKAIFRALLSGGGTQDKTIAFSIGVTSCAAPTTGGVTICSPSANSTLTNPVNLSAVSSAPSGQHVTAMKLYIDGVSKASSSSTSLTAQLTLSIGKHTVTFQAWTNTGLVEKASETITVSQVSSLGCVPDGPQQSQICVPVAASTVGSPVNITAGSRAAVGSFIYSMRVYVDGTSAITVNNPTAQGTTQLMNVNIPISVGSHNISVVTYESNGAPAMKVSEPIIVH